jgi:hypothetical protein
MAHATYAAERCEGGFTEPGVLLYVIVASALELPHRVRLVRGDTVFALLDYCGLTNFNVKRSDSPIAAYLARSWSPSA